jgi:hypothetical protein
VSGGQLSVAGDGWLLAGTWRLLPTSSGRRISTSGGLSIGTGNASAAVNLSFDDG